jgi:PAS domain S-box-containing protein
MKKKPAATAGRRVQRQSLRPATARELSDAAFAMARFSALDPSIDIGEEFLRTLSALLPGRAIALRLIDPRTLHLRSMESVGALKAGAHAAPLALKASAIRRTGLPEMITVSGRVEVQARYPTLFEETAGGFAVPIAAMGRLHGAVNVELPPAGKSLAKLLAADEAVVIPLANQLAVALRNLELLSEARRAEEQLQTILARANVLIAVLDRDANIVLLNDACRRYLALPSSMRGRIDMRTWMRERPGVGEPRLGNLALRAIAGEELDGIEGWAARYDGSAFHALWSLTALRNAAGEVDRVIVVGHDVDRERQLERQVIQSEKLATIGKLAAGVVHELNNPLTSIGVYADYLVKRLEKIDPQDAEKARRIVEGAGRIQRLTQDLVSYARPSGERISLDVSEVLSRALSFCEHVIAQAGGRLEVSYSPSLPRVLGLRGQLEQVFINLITNACHALGEGGGAIRVSTAAAAGGVAITVGDEGGGIADEHRAHIFEPFFTTKREGRGTGLGLSIVKNIVEAHGGSVGFESSGAGTNFTVVLPAVPPVAGR